MPGEWFEFRGTRLEQSDSGSSTWLGRAVGDEGFISITKTVNTSSAQPTSVFASSAFRARPTGKLLFAKPCRGAARCAIRPPGPPSNILSDRVCAGSAANLSWTAGTGGVGWYEFKYTSYGTGADPYNSPTSSLDANAVAMTFSPCRLYTTYVYLRSCNAGGCSAWATRDSFLPLGIPPCR